MSYQEKDIIVTPEFFQKHSDNVTAIPPKEVYSIGGKGGAVRAVLADCAIEKCACKIFRDIDRFISPELKNVIQEYNLFTFGYAYDRMKRSYHIRIIISTQPSVKLRWFKEDIWAGLSVFEEPGDAFYLGIIEYNDSGYYSTYRFSDHIISTNKDTSFYCSSFNLDDLKLKVCAVNKAKESKVDLPEAKFEILDDRGLSALGDEIVDFIQAKSESEKRKNLSIPVAPNSELKITKDMLKKSGSISLIPKDGFQNYPNGWPFPKIIEDVTPFVTPDFKEYLDSVGDNYFVFAIDNGFHSDMSTGMAVISVVVFARDEATIMVHSNYRAVLVPSAGAHYGEARFYSCPMMGGYRVITNNLKPRYYSGIFDTVENSVKISDSSGFDLLELEMRRGRL